MTSSEDVKKGESFMNEKAQKAFKSSPFTRKLNYYLDFKNRGPFVYLGVGLAVYIIGYNVAVKLLKGNEHPGNNFMWRIKKANGTLSQELIDKERIIQEYHKSKLDFTDSNVRPWLASVFE